MARPKPAPLFVENLGWIWECVDTEPTRSHHLTRLVWNYLQCKPKGELKVYRTTNEAQDALKMAYKLLRG